MGKKRIPDRDAEDDSEAVAFRTAMRDVKPLAVQPPRHAPALARRTRMRPPPRAAAEDLDETMPLIATAADADAAAALSFQRGGVQDQVMRRLRRGLIPSEDELDLHGLNQTEARDRLLKSRQDKPAEHGQPPKNGLANAEGPGNQGDAASDPSG